MGSRLKKSLKVLSQRAQGAFTCYRITASILGTDPVVSREVQIDGEFSLEAVHHFLQDIFGWNNKHIHKFIVNGEVFMDRRDAKLLEGQIWDEDIALCFLKLSKGQRITYEYGGWQHELAVIEVNQITEKDDYSMVLDGRGACIPEDCGDIDGYNKLRVAYKDESSKQHKKALKALGAGFKPSVWKEKEEQLD